MLDANMKQQLGAYLNNLRHAIEIQVSVNGTAKSNELEELAKEIAELNDKVSFSTTDAPINGRSPVMTVTEAGKEARVAFAGVPMGHEFTSLVLALLQGSCSA